MASRNLETGTPDLQARLEDRVLTLTMNRPDARNALSDAMLDALAAQLARAEADADIGCIVLTGAGRAFCAGGDLKAMAEGDVAAPSLSTEAQIDRQRLVQRATAGKLFRLPKPTIAAVNGAAAGAGLSLALACDLRVMSSTAFLVTAFAKVGLPGDFGGAYFLSQIVGTAKAREIFYLSERVDSAEAMRLGLTNWCFDADSFEIETAVLAARLAAGPAVALGFMKENLGRALVAEVETCLDLEASHHVHCTTTVDHKEAVAAFAEKRTPLFNAT